MKKILLLLVVCCTLGVAQAQRVYFFYLQSDNKTPFYLKTGDEVFSSSAAGYLIVPRLVDSTYNVVIGKPGKPEVRFSIPVNQKDRGFLLREVDQKLSLFDMHDMTLIEPVQTGGAPVAYQKKTDRFSRLLAQAADDTTLLQVAVVNKENKAPAPPPAVVKADTPKETQQAAPPVVEKDTQTAVVQVQTAVAPPDSAAIAAQSQKTPERPQATEVVKEEVKTVKEEAKEAETAKADLVKTETVTENPVQPQTPVAESEFKRSVVTRRSESSTSEGFGLVFTDSADGVVDTIRLVIPNPKVPFQTGTEAATRDDSRFLQLDNQTAAKEPAPKTSTSEQQTAAAEPVKKEKKTARNKEKKEAEQTEATVATAETGCKNMASGNDVARLRRSMVGRNSEEDMIAEGVRVFKNRCFTTEQLKGLSSLLLTSHGRYRFFEVAYPHVSDKQNFKNLQNELWDREDINRFKALIAR